MAHSKLVGEQPRQRSIHRTLPRGMNQLRDLVEIVLNVK